MARFDRDYRLLIGPPGRDGAEILPPLRITFEIERDAAEAANYHRVRIWNLSKATREAIIAPENFMALYAGYKEEDGPVLCAAGTVVFGYVYVDGPDVVTELEVLDGYAELRDTVVSLGYGAGVKASVVLRDIARQMGLHLVLGVDLPDRAWSNGFSFYGAARTALHKIVAGTGAEWSVQNGELQVLARRGVTPRAVTVLAADSGLVGYPERTRVGAREKAQVKDKKTGDIKDIVSARQQRDGWRVKSLLLPHLNPGDLVKMESRSVEGFFRIEKLVHTGDWGGPGDWQTELQLVDRDAPPAKKKKATP